MKKFFLLLLFTFSILNLKLKPTFAVPPGCKYCDETNCVSQSGICLPDYNECETSYDCGRSQPPARDDRGIVNPALPFWLGEGSPSEATSRYLSTIVSTLIVLGGLLAFFYLLYGAIEWLMSGGDPEKIKQAQRKITYAIAGLFLLTAIFAIANLIGEVLGIDLLNINLSKIAPDA